MMLGERMLQAQSMIAGLRKFSEHGGFPLGFCDDMAICIPRDRWEILNEYMQMLCMFKESETLPIKALRIGRVWVYPTN